MNQVNTDQLFESIKSDNLVVFSDIAQNCLNLCYGRFPILTLCYLYNAKKILKQYKDKLLKIRIYAFAPEKFEMYKKFKSIAGRCLRIYCEENCIISAIELLAILDKENQVKKLFNLYTTNVKIVENLKHIYCIKNQTVKIKLNRIRIQPKLLTKNQNKLLKATLFASLAVVMFFGVCLTVFGLNYGYGINGQAIKIYTSQQLSAALKSNANISLQNNICIDQSINVLEFSGTLEGNNKTLYLNDVDKSCFIKNNVGKIKNLNVVVFQNQKQIDGDFSLFVQTNLGNITNVNINCENLKLTCQNSLQKDIGVAVLTSTNNGSIDNCKIQINANISADGKCVVSVFSNKNFGQIKNCEVTKTSILSVIDANVTTMAVYNEFGGKILNCKNNAAITHTSAINGLSPAVSGIAIANYGVIENCLNLQSLKLTSELQTTSNKIALLGGITCVNYGGINKCLNKADLRLDSHMLMSYCGGICAYGDEIIKDNKIYFPTITNCGQQGNINVTNEDQYAYTLVGGIAGFLYGKLENCYSITNFLTAYDVKKHFVGTCVGAIYIKGGSPILDVKNNFVLISGAAPTHTGALIDGVTIIGAGLNAAETQIKTLSTQDEIKATGVYWDV